MPYVVMVDDNFHYMDENERYQYGEFADPEVAIGHCRRIVDEYLASAYAAGMSASELWDSYVSFGEDPFVLSVDAPRAHFSAWEYAKEQCQARCDGQNPPHLPSADPSDGPPT